MAGNLEEKAGSSITCAATGSTSSLNNGAAVAATAGGGNLTNSTGLNYSTIARLTAACATNPGEGVRVSLYLVRVADGTNAATADTSTPYISPNCFVGYLYWPGTATATTYIMD